MAKKKTSSLFKHPNGQWCKKVLGKPVYFGTDENEALDRWLAEKDHLLAGRVPPTRQHSANAKTPTVGELANLFTARCQNRVASGEMAQRSVDDYAPTLKRFIEIVGRECRTADLTPMDFADIKEKFAEPVKRVPIKRSAKSKIKDKRVFGRVVKRRSPTTVASDCRRIRAFLKWCQTSELIPPPRYGENFAPITAKALKRHEAKQERRDIAPADLRAIIEASSKTFRPLLLLAINAGIGNLDLADMQLSKLPKLEGEVWINLPRGKTGAERRFVLWPETVDAIRIYLASRSGPAGPSNIDRLFLTRHGLGWVRVHKQDRKDAIAGAFTKFRKLVGVERGTFYDLRRTFQTVAAETLDFPAVSFVMGHTPKRDDMAAKYNQHIGDDRIRRVCEHVRTWLYGDAKASVANDK